MGKVSKDDLCIPHSTTPYHLPCGDYPDLSDDSCVSVNYHLPPSQYLHRSVLLKGLEMPPRVLVESEGNFEGMGRHMMGQSAPADRWNAPQHGWNNRSNSNMRMYR